MLEAGQSSLIEAMLQPSFYAHSVSEPIELIQTHISYVFLTGEFAYKVKKAVNFGFLDFSTLEKRQHFCAEELRLNRRGAPDLYLEVLPVTQREHQFELNGAGEPVEYVLKMLQFPQETLFSTMFDQNELTQLHLEQLGRVVAQYHAQAQTNDYIRSFGEVEQVRDAINKNYQQTKKYVGSLQSQSRFLETKQYTDSFFEERSQLFNSRIESNKIRECHGDLHLRNICLWQEKILLFDCIEFNEPFRFVDVMYDVAFTVMDLEARQRPDLGNVFLNTYVEQTGDWEGLQVLPLYLSRQAYVRAKVNSLLLDDPAVGAAAQQEASVAAARYYQLAWAYTQPRAGQLLLMSGLSGAGKSTVARQLARQIGAIHIRSDAVRKHLAGIALQARGGDELYTAKMNQKTYERILALGIMLANQGFSVILDAKYDQQHLRLNALNQAQFHKLPVQILHCTAPIEVLRERLQKRAGDIADATAELLVAQQAAAEPFSVFEQTYVKTIDTTKPLNVLAIMN